MYVISPYNHYRLPEMNPGLNIFCSRNFSANFIAYAIYKAVKNQFISCIRISFRLPDHFQLNFDRSCSRIVRISPLITSKIGNQKYSKNSFFATLSILPFFSWIDWKFVKLSGYVPMTILDRRITPGTFFDLILGSAIVPQKRYLMEKYETAHFATVQAN